MFKRVVVDVVVLQEPVGDVALSVESSPDLPKKVDSSSKTISLLRQRCLSSQKGGWIEKALERLEEKVARS